MAAGTAVRQFTNAAAHRNGPRSGSDLRAQAIANAVMADRQMDEPREVAEQAAERRWQATDRAVAAAATRWEQAAAVARVVGVAHPKVQVAADRVVAQAVRAAKAVAEAVSSQIVS
jgi:hypothetical protein